jgi:hypothetical protein
LLLYFSRTHRSDETEFSWRYVTRNSKPKYTEEKPETVNHRSKKTMGIENADGKEREKIANSVKERILACAILKYYPIALSLTLVLSLIHHVHLNKNFVYILLRILL